MGFSHRSLVRGTAVALFALAVSQGSAFADVSFGTTYGGAGNNFTANINGSANFTVQGSGSLGLSSPPILGTPVGLVSASVNLPQQTVTVNVGANINTTPTGTGTISLQDLYVYQTFGGGPDGKADDGSVINSQMSGSIDALDVTLVSSQVVGANSVTLNGSATFTSFPFNVVGGVTVPLQIDLTPGILLQNLQYVQVGPALMGAQVAINPGYADGAHPNVPATQNLSTQYPFVISGGNLSGSGDIQVGAVFSADLGIFGTFSSNLGTLTAEGLDLTQVFGLIGVGQFIEIPTATSPTDFDDLIQTLSGNISSILGDLTLPLTLSGSIPLSQTFTVPLSLGFLGTINFDADFNGSLSYTLDGSIVLTNLTYALQSQQIADAVNVPEASSLAMLGLTGLGGLAFSLYRRRKNG